MQFRTRLAGWVFVILLVGLPVGYFAARFEATSFVDATFANWLATILGVLGGVPLGFEVNRRVQRAQQAEELARQREENRKSRAALLQHVGFELDHNARELKNLSHALAQYKGAHLHTWQWADQVVNSFAFAGFEALLESNLVPIWQIETVWAPYRELRSLANSVHQATAAHTFFGGYSPGSMSNADAMWRQVREAIADAEKLIDRARVAREQLSAEAGA